MLSHFTCSRGEPQAAIPPSPCAKSDNMSSNKKSPPQGSAESKLYRAGLRSLYTIVVAVDICPCPSNTNISRLVSIVKRVSIFVRQNITFVVTFCATAPPSPHGQRGAAVAPVNHNSAPARNSLIGALGIPCLRRVYLATRREPVHFFGRTPSASMGDMCGLFLTDMSRGERLYFPLFGENLHRHACPLD